MNEALDYLNALIVSGADRGRDSFGVLAAGVTDNGHVHLQKRKWPGSPLELSKGLQGYFAQVAAQASLTGELPSVIINNDRAEPTTEWVALKLDDAIQPFETGAWAITHNGTIANDKEVFERCASYPPAPIDSYALSTVFDYTFGDTLPSVERVRDMLNAQVVGSYAFAAVNKYRPEMLYLGVNYKPLTLVHNRRLRTVFFTSLEGYAQSKSLWTLELLSDPMIQITRVPAYTVVQLSSFMGQLQIDYATLREPPNDKVLIVCSGGLDSTTAAAIHKAEGKEIGLVHFRYGCQAETKEVEAVRAIGEYYQCPVYWIDVPSFSQVIGGSTLFQKDAFVTTREGVSGAEFAHEWVPARNLVFLSMAVALAEAKGYGYVSSGINLEESGAYPDNEMEFILRLREVMPYAVGPNSRVELLMPVGNMMKHEIVAAGLYHEAPLHLTWSCYGDGEYHCGKCGPDFMRRRAFEMAGAVDPVKYADQ